MGGWGRKTGDWGREKTERPKAKANPATRMDSVAKESGSSRARLKGPRGEAPIEGDVGEGSAAVEVGGKMNEQKKIRQLKIGG
jgi:hypothetical protein